MSDRELFEDVGSVEELPDPEVSVSRKLPDPVVIEIRRDHAYKKKSGKNPRGCAVCEQAKTHAVHLGRPPSFNDLLSADIHAYRALKNAWHDVVSEQLRRSGLPRGLESVRCEAWITFSDRRKRDEGNFRVFIEKVLGDALEAGGWIASDEFYVYQFDRVHPRIERNESWIRIQITPQLGDL